MLPALARRTAVPVVVIVAMLALGSCTDGDGDRAEAPASSTSSSPSDAPTSSTAAPTVPLDQVALTLTPVADVASPTALAVRPGDEALYVTEQTGRVVAVRDGEVTEILDLADALSTGFEQGLLGLAFSPDGTHLFLDRTDPDGDTSIDEYAMDDEGVVDTASRRTILTVDQPFPNHNGGQLAFGPDGMLWIGLGDGGGAGDPNDNAQDVGTLLGSILRIDPDGGDPYGIPDDNPFVDDPDARPEIWALGLRNPWRFSFDAQTGDLWIADVGQQAREEIDLAPAPDLGRGANYGWPFLEGTQDFRGGAPDGTVPPVFEYARADGACSVTGGFVYRGERIPELTGAYLFSDYCDGTIRAIRVEGGAVVDEAAFAISAPDVTSFGMDGDGELYVLSLSDGLARLDPA